MSQPDTTPSGALLARLFVAALLIAALTIVGRLVLPSAGLTLPLWVPALTFAAIAVAVLLTAWQERQDENGDDEDDGPGDTPDIAGHIGPDDAQD